MGGIGIAPIFPLVTVEAVKLFKLYVSFILNNISDLVLSGIK